MKRGYKNPLGKRFSEEFFKSIPKTPGVYFMRDGGDKILYIGKAQSLRTRLRSYARAQPSKVGKNVIRMLEKVVHIDWEMWETEELARERELELIRAVVPPYNIQAAWREEYFFIGLRGPKGGKIEFRLTKWEEDALDCELFGCYPARRKVKLGFGALLRVLFACGYAGQRFYGFPAKISQSSPAYQYTIKFDRPLRWKNLLTDYFQGQSNELLKEIMKSLLANDNLPEFVRPGLQKDLNAIKVFDRACVKRRSQMGDATKVFSHRELRKHIKESISPVQAATALESAK